MPWRRLFAVGAIVLLACLVWSLLAPLEVPGAAEASAVGPVSEVQTRPDPPASYGDPGPESPIEARHRAFTEHIGATVAEAERRCHTGRMAYECHDGVCAVRWHAPRDAEWYDSVGEDPYQPVKQLGLLGSTIWKWGPCLGTLSKLVTRDHSVLARGDCFIVVDPTGPPWRQVERERMLWAIERCLTMEVH